MEALEQLEQNLSLLITQYQALLSENQQLQRTVEEQRKEIVQTHSELVELQDRYKHLQVAHAMIAPDNEGKEKAYQRLSALIAKVDSAVEILRGWT